ncbi:MAG: putative rRNA maturation factor [Parcubacteria group bacterium GW2011_GWA1_47_10]|nr:MAG: putative rRNA maturation factor [Parcubacteria group bacterium GW2011_GWA1_47_10]
MEKKFARMKNDILGKNYSLSIAYVTPAKSRELNKKYRKKDKATNVLAFPLRKDMGELVLCPGVIKKEAKNFGRTFEQFLGFLVIHGMLHLKGGQHSSKMGREEEKYDKKYFSRDRRRVIRNPRRGGRIPKRRNES